MDFAKRSPLIHASRASTISSAVLPMKFHHKVFKDVHLTRMEEITRAVCTDFECELIEFNGENNHVHPLVNFPPKLALSKLVNSLKGVSSRRLRQEYPELVRHYCRAQRLRSDSYFAGSGRGSTVDREAAHRAAEPARPNSGRQRGPVRTARVRTLLKIASPPG